MRKLRQNQLNTPEQGRKRVSLNDPDAIVKIRQMLIGDELAEIRGQLKAQQTRLDAHIRSSEARFVQVRDNFLKVQNYLSEQRTERVSAETEMLERVRAELASARNGLDEAIAESRSASMKRIEERLRDAGREMHERAIAAQQAAEAQIVSKQGFASILRQLASSVEGPTR